MIDGVERFLERKNDADSNVDYLFQDDEKKLKRIQSEKEE
jgi:hypothetical protein